MQFIAELLTAFMVWLAAAVLIHFGVEVDLDRQASPIVERVIEQGEAAAPHPISQACPEAAREAVRGPLQAA